VGVLLINSAREAVAETVDVRLIVVERVYVGHEVGVLDCPRLRVGDIVNKVVRVTNADKLVVALLLELTELVVEDVTVFDWAIVFVVLTLAETVLEPVDVEDAVGVYIGVTVLLEVVVILDDPEDVLDWRVFWLPVDDPEEVLDELIDPVMVVDEVGELDILPLAEILFDTIIVLEP